MTITITVFSAYPFEQPYLTAAAQNRYRCHFVGAALTLETAEQAAGSTAVAVFVNDDASAPVLEKLRALGVRYLLVRAAGHDNVDSAAAHRLGLRVATVPHYSPFAIAEHALALMLALNRHLHQADAQVRRGDFRLDNLIGFDLHGKTVGIVGCGTIGGTLAGLLHGFGCRLLGHDIEPDAELTRRYGLEYVPLDELCARADVVSLHAPLTPATRHLFNAAQLARLRPGAMLINTGRGALLDTEAALAALESGHLGYLGLDVYEHEKGLFFNDHSHKLLPDVLLAQLLAQPNVLVTGHQGFLTREALTSIATTTIESLDSWLAGQPTANELLPAAEQPAAAAAAQAAVVPAGWGLRYGLNTA
ncbi:2-hydroxyacid dehydrogenase [Hymenobacter actinosclerus]|uniref:D-lactate dehydrogenase n=1 Tax=Hymenobacter actinosclerus TaxID=82805 RepID=A0A1I0DVJ1_9BACT|nr:2-hydroxyacid dehydrogenase [Hymenobacter actinosclerus]SET36648.1 D-lactate dehydrogenase [Hymenobacter actinosclerus]